MKIWFVVPACALKRAAFFGMHVISHSGLPFCKSNKTKYIDDRKYFPLDECPYRTTLCLRTSGWELVERCARCAPKDQSRLEALNAPKAITILSREWINVEEFGTSQFPTSQASGCQRGGGQNVGLHLGQCQLTPIYNGWVGIHCHLERGNHFVKRFDLTNFPTCIAGNCFDMLWVRQLTSIGTRLAEKGSRKKENNGSSQACPPMVQNYPVALCIIKFNKNLEILIPNVRMQSSAVYHPFQIGIGCVPWSRRTT